MIDFRELLKTTENSCSYRLFNHLSVGDYTLSIQASSAHYCEPRKTLENIYDYTSMELAIFKGKGTKFIDISDDSFFNDWKYKNKFLEENFDGVLGGYVDIYVIQSLYEYILSQDKNIEKTLIDKTTIILDQAISKANGEEFTNDELEEFLNDYIEWIESKGLITGGCCSYYREEE